MQSMPGFERRIRSLPRMKELLRWAAAVKAQKGGIKRYWKASLSIPINKSKFDCILDANTNSFANTVLNFDVEMLSLKVSYFRNRVAARDPIDESSSNSSRISFKWDAGSCSTSSSVYSPISVSRTVTVSGKKNDIGPFIHTRIDSEIMLCPREDCNRAAQWITTDADFVVLEL